MIRDMTKTTTTRRLICQGLLLLMLFSIAPQIVYADEAMKAEYAALRKYREILGIIQKNYLREMSYPELVDLTIKGFLNQLDPHSMYLDQKMYNDLLQPSNGKFGTISVEVSPRATGLEVISVIEGGPADLVGIRSGDIITGINGVATGNIDLLKAVELIRGPVGSEITIDIKRHGLRKPIKITMHREQIKHPVPYAEKLDHDIAYLRIPIFQENTTKEIKKELNKITKSTKLQGLIIDLRNNPGGLLDEAVAVANLFLSKGVIVAAKGRVKEQNMEFKASEKVIISGKPKIAVLINQGTSSGSEILAGALQEEYGAAVFGKESFRRRCTIQTIVKLDDGGALRLTTAEFISPNGRSYHKEGVIPDLDMSKEMETMSKQSSTRAPSMKKDAVNPKTDPVVQKAVEWIKSGKPIQVFKYQ